MDWFPIIYGLVFGSVVGVAMVEYSRWRMKRLVSSMIEDFIRKVREDGETEAKIKEMINKVVDYAIDRIKQRMMSYGGEGNDSMPPKLEKYYSISKNSSD